MRGGRAGVAMRVGNLPYVAAMMVKMKVVDDAPQNRR